MSQIIYYPFEESEDSQRIFTSLNNKYGRPINHSMFISPRREDIYRFVVPDISPNWCKEYKFVWGFGL